MLKKYKVVGNTPVMRTRPGCIFEAELKYAHEKMLIEAGAIRVATEDDLKPRKKETKSIKPSISEGDE